MFFSKNNHLKLLFSHTMLMKSKFLQNWIKCIYLSFMIWWNHWIFYIVCFLFKFIGTSNFYRAFQIFWIDFSIGFGIMQIRSKTWALRMIVFHNLPSTLKELTKYTEWNWRVYDYLCHLVKNFFFSPHCSFIPLP